tara:strand:+ start:40 stop:336 length:297 start_codon:yes stop_codon:yes gene_type:complete
MKYLILAGALLSIAGTASAEGRCNRPYAPTINVTAATSPEALARLRTDVRTFVAASDIYQTCLSSSLLTSNTQRLIDANQQDKQRVVSAYNAAARSRS